jgi:hypothetical protein
MTDSQRDLVLHLLRAGDWPDAIVAYMDETGADEETAREAVGQLARDHQLRRSYTGWITLAAAASALLLLLAGWIVAH